MIFWCPGFSWVIRSFMYSIPFLSTTSVFNVLKPRSHQTVLKAWETKPCEIFETAEIRKLYSHYRKSLIYFVFRSKRKKSVTTVFFSLNLPIDSRIPFIHISFAHSLSHSSFSYFHSFLIDTQNKFSFCISFSTCERINLTGTLRNGLVLHFFI